MLDEAIPNDPAFSESQFDAHFDTVGFTYAIQDLVRRLSDRRDGPGGDGGEREDTGEDGCRAEPRPDALVDAVLDRRDRGHPDYSLFLNSVENHDEHRLLGVAAVDPLAPDRDDVTDAEWDRAAGLERAAFAACITLPGIPTVYYGTEREIGRYGTGRVDGPTDWRGLTPGGGIDPDADVRPGGRQRAFMNWEAHDADHLAFYRRMIDLYHDLDALGADAALEPLASGTDAEAACFVRDASGLTGNSGPERVLVVLNFEADPVEVDLPPGVEPTNLAERTDGETEPTTGGGPTAEEGQIVVGTVGVFPLDGSLKGAPTVRLPD
jgi:glycosidase